MSPNVLFQGAFFMPFFSGSQKRTERGSQHVQLKMGIFRKR
ncbi:hypothetical protein D2M30_4217 [Bacillus amyloliquefaciens]|nr:hypothetical protein D2M30_4217 [Bacillus amyloliquefaciens]